MRIISLFFFAFFVVGAHAACEVTISAPDLLQYDKKELEVSRSCGTVKLTFVHTGKLPKNIMGHNWVLSEEKYLNAIAQEGGRAGLENSYVKPGDDRVIAFTKIIGGGETTEIEFSVADLPTATLAYYCTFPGHWTIMKGILRVVA
ncbi:MAG: azurin [Gammaproteobacteria bacterium]|mgnify:FL=1|nr:azurin [Gammaproteobacteria bacterium]|tara:strand:- start:492 stop:929 length:438 start_codon:yes stop_codon:yes gene_type:complete